MAHSKPMKIIIAYDGSAFADAAIEELGRAGFPADSEIAVLSVADAWELPEIVGNVSDSGGRVSQKNIAAIQQHLEKVIADTSVLAESAAARIRTMFPDATVSAESRTGKPAVELLKFSDEWQADLIVVGSHGRGFVGRAILGSVSMKVLHEAQCSVRIARKRINPEGQPPKILVAVDGSENADLCIEDVARRTWPANTELRIITADDDPASRPETSVLDAVPEGKEDSDEAKAWVERVLNAPAQKLAATGLNVSQNCRWGDARRVILDEAETWKADCIFIGARGLTRLKRLLIGSVSSTVAARAECSVEVVRVRSDG